MVAIFLALFTLQTQQHTPYLCIYSAKEQHCPRCSKKGSSRCMHTNPPTFVPPYKTKQPNVHVLHKSGRFTIRGAVSVVAA